MENKGQEGFEYSYDQWLQGEPGSKQVVKDLFQRTIKNVRQVKEARVGKDLALSIDLRLQYLAYRELKEAVKRHRADAGSIVLLDVSTGEVLAMVNQPAFNPNDRANIKIEAVRNRAITDVFEPGSTVKPITVMAALESGKYQEHSLVNTSPGYIKVGRKTLLDPRDYGLIDVSKVIAKSSQVGIAKIGLSLEQERLHEAFFRLGLGQFVGTGFPGEGTGYLPNSRRWHPIEQAAFSFGAGLSVTALQMAQAYSVFASGGIKRNISLIKREQPVEGVRVLDVNIAHAIQRMLAGVAAPGGTALNANTEYYTVAGKTGTSHKVGKGGYDYGRYISLFAGFAPAVNPRLVAIVVIDDPKGKEYYGGEVAAPIFSSLMASSLRILNVTPDKIGAEVARAQWVAKQ
jgi:cell division protein FtsI (penicillin-binding protein 3)